MGKKVYDMWSLETTEDHLINSMIMEQACDNADTLTQMDCLINGVVCNKKDEDGSITYTDEAQDIFNIYYDEQTTELYRLLNSQMKIIKV